MDEKPKKCTVCFEPSGLKTEVPVGTILLEAARKAGVYLSSICGGDGYCGKCKVIIDQGQFQSRPTTLLTPDETRENTVLACQTKVLSDMTITVPKFHTLQTSQILMDTDAHRFRSLPVMYEKAYLSLTLWFRSSLSRCRNPRYTTIQPTTSVCM